MSATPVYSKHLPANLYEAISSSDQSILQSLPISFSDHSKHVAMVFKTPAATFHLHFKEGKMISAEAILPKKDGFSDESKMGVVCDKKDSLKHQAIIESVIKVIQNSNQLFGKKAEAQGT